MSEMPVNDWWNNPKAGQVEQAEKLLDEAFPPTISNREIMKKKRVYKGGTVHEYVVADIPDGTVDYDVIHYCDPGNFGGRVVRTSATTAKVWVYVD